jgi:hypothetical protein
VRLLEDFLNVVLHRIAVHTHVPGPLAILSDAGRERSGICREIYQIIVTSHHYAHRRINGYATLRMQALVHRIGAFDVINR